MSNLTGGLTKIEKTSERSTGGSEDGSPGRGSHVASLAAQADEMLVARGGCVFDGPPQSSDALVYLIAEAAEFS